MLGTYGFEWDEARKVMTFRDDDIWNEYVKEWIDIFGKDKATGESGEDYKGTSGKKKKSKKRQIDESIGDRMVEMMGKFCEQTNENLQAIGKRIGYEVSLGEKRKKLFEVLGKLEVLTTDQQILVAKSLINNNKDLELFFSLPDDARTRMATLMVTD
ncbi:hypothetical protein ACS0TY_018558 [Phlomoides rotata]